MTTNHSLARQMREYVLLLALCAAGVALSLTSLHRGWINPEAEGFIPHYLSQKPLPDLIFDPAHTDWGNYQGRELSYLFDWIDCQFILLCTKAGFPHFISLTHLALVVVVAVILFYFVRRDCALPPCVALALVAVWITAPAAVLGANFYRSAKIACAAAMLVMITAAWRGRQSGSGLLSVGSAGLVAALCDRQGFVLLLFFVVWTAWRGFGWNERPTLRLATAAACALVAAQCYTSFVGPVLIAHYTGHRPNTGFMRLNWGELLHDTAQMKAVFVYAPISALQSIGFQFGNVPSVLLGSALVMATFALTDRPGNGTSPVRRHAQAFWWIAILPAVVALNMGMALRQANVVMLAEFKRIYFPLPATIWLFVVVAVAISTTVGRTWIRPQVAAGFLAVITLSNLVSLPAHRLAYDRGVYSPQIKAGPSHLDALKQNSRRADDNPAVRALREKAWPNQPNRAEAPTASL